MAATSSYSSPRADAAASKSRSSSLDAALERLDVGGREPYAHLRLVVGALQHVEPRDAAVEALRQRPHAARAHDLHEPGALEHLQVVGDRPLGEADLLGELGRRRRPLAQERDDPQPDVVGERAQLLGLGDDEDVVGLVVRQREIEETVDSCRKIRQPSTVRKRVYGLNVPSGPAGSGPIPPARARVLPGTPFTASVENANVSCANAIRSLLTSSACTLTFANVSQARW